MDIFCVTKVTGEVVKSGFSSREEARVERDKLLAESGATKEEIDNIRGIRELPYRVSKGKNHCNAPGGAGFY